eukprot:COSAG06_NODE_43267_length_371_cov_1.401460_1_plen_42_part_10
MIYKDRIAGAYLDAFEAGSVLVRPHVVEGQVPCSHKITPVVC